MLPLEQDLSELFDIDEFAKGITWTKNGTTHNELCIMQSPEILVRLGIFSIEETNAVACMETAKAGDLGRDDVVSISETVYRVTHTFNDQWGIVRLGLALNHDNDTEDDEVFEWQ